MRSPVFNLCCLFCGELLSVNTELIASCLGCGMKGLLKVEQECVKGFEIQRCGRLCTCEESHEPW